MDRQYLILIFLIIIVICFTQLEGAWYDGKGASGRKGVWKVAKDIKKGVESATDWVEQAAKDTAKWTEQAAKDVGNAVRDAASSVLGKNNTLCTQACPPGSTNMGLYCASKMAVKTRKTTLPNGCKGDRQFSNMMCYKPCKWGSYGIGPYCFPCTRNVKATNNALAIGSLHPGLALMGGPPGVAAAIYDTKSRNTRHCAKIASDKKLISENGGDTDGLERCTGPDCSGYRGNQKKTRDGKKCINWTVANGGQYASAGDHNKCRNPGGGKSSIWCYTNKNSSESGQCDPIDYTAEMRKFDEEANKDLPSDTPIPKEECSGIKCSEYKGTQDTTIDGVKCQKWEDGINNTAENGLCRNIGSEKKTIWCYTNTKAKTIGYCAPRATISTSGGVPKEECSGKNCSGYRGFQDKTISGKTCQEWKVNTPQKVPSKFTPAGAPNAGLEKNYCRNPDPDGNKSIWCYTTDPKTRWEQCKPKSPDDIANALNATIDAKKTAAFGNTTLPPNTDCTKLSGDDKKRCIVMKKFGKTSKLETCAQPKGYCGHPGAKNEAKMCGGVPGNWCTDGKGGSGFAACTGNNPPGSGWPKGKCMDLGETAKYIESPKYKATFEKCAGTKCKDYIGFQDTRRDGKKCINWKVGNGGKYKSMGDHNKCRNPDGGDTIWCYSNKNNNDWGYCDIKYPKGSCAQPVGWCNHAGSVLEPKVCGGVSGYLCTDSGGGSGFKPCPGKSQPPGSDWPNGKCT